MKFRLVMLVLLSGSVVACTAPGAAVKNDAANDTAVAGTAATDSAAVDVTATSRELLEVQVRDMQKEAVYFDFDRSVVRPEFRDLLARQAELMSANQNLIVTLEGRADERGSEEYNFRLSKKRAEAVRDILQSMGVPGNQIVVLGLGEENPRATCHEERCWGENRRVDFVGYLGS